MELTNSQPIVNYINHKEIEVLIVKTDCRGIKRNKYNETNKVRSGVSIN